MTAKDLETSKVGCENLRIKFINMRPFFDIFGLKGRQVKMER